MQDDEQGLLQIVNDVDVAAEIEEAIAPLLDPIGVIGKAPKPGSVGRSILRGRQARLGGRYASIGELEDVLATALELREPHELEKLRERIRETLARAPWTTHPALLLPLRLETRFKGGQLLVRIYPDQISVSTHESDLTQSEYQAVREYDDAPSETKRDAWRLLSTQFGPERAAWLVTWSGGHDFSGPPPQFRQDGWTAPRLMLLPDRFHVFAYRGGQLIRRAMSEAVQRDRSVIASPDASGGEGLFDARSRWMVDFADALTNGFAVEIEVDSTDLEQGFDRVVAVGLRWSTAAQGKAQLEDLFRSHRFTGSAEFIRPGTPTNNTEDSPSGYTMREDHDEAYAIEVEGPLDWTTAAIRQRMDADRLARALGIDVEVLRHLRGAGHTGESFAEEVNTVTWPSTGDYYLRHLLPDTLSETQLAHVADHHRGYVRGAGPLPSLRFGRQPYGILPVTFVHPGGPTGWSPWDGDPSTEPELDRRLNSVVANLHDRWLAYASKPGRVPRVQADDDDPDATLLGILAMEPRSISYRARPFVDERFVGWLLAVLREYAFGPGTPYDALGLSPVEWMGRWAATWNQAEERTATLLASLSQEDAATFGGKPLLQMLAWFEGQDQPVGVTIDRSDQDLLPGGYLTELCRQSETSAQTLLAETVRRALALAPADATRAGILDAVCRLSGAGVLQFFNRVTDPQEIVDRIRDDPLVHPERRGYGVRISLARTILQRREDLGGFTSIEQIDAIRGVGFDTLHDILHSLKSADGPADLERLFHESLDLATHRVDAWVTSFATKRLAGMRAADSGREGVHVGAYGFVEDLQPRGMPLSEGYLHAPSGGQAAAAAVLYNAYLTHDPQLTGEPGETRTANPFRINLTSGRVRRALAVLDGVRQGQPLGALLGYRFERSLKDRDLALAQYIADLREIFPAVANKIPETATDEPASVVAARNVVDGAALVTDYREGGGKVADFLGGVSPPHAAAIRDVLDQVEDTMDAVSDLFVTESVYQAVQGNFDRSGAALEAASGNQAPPEIEAIATPVSGHTFTHRVCALFNDELAFADAAARATDPRAAAEPRVAAWMTDLIGPLGDIGVGFDFWEEETDAAVLERVNVNTAGSDQLASLPGIDPDIAEAVIAERTGPRGPFKQLRDLERVSGIGAGIVAGLRDAATTGWVERVDVNTATADRLEALPGISPALAQAIVDERGGRPFRRIADLTRVSGIGSAIVDGLRSRVSAVLTDVNTATPAQLETLPEIGSVLSQRIIDARAEAPFRSTRDLLRVDGIDADTLNGMEPWITTAFGVITVADLGLSGTDFLYTAQAPPEGGETELEQRVALVVRQEFGLPASQRVDVDADRHGPFDRALADAAELARQALRFLAAGRPAAPDTLSHPGEGGAEGYAATDVTALAGRVAAAQAWVSSADASPGVVAQGDTLAVPSTVSLRFTGISGTIVPAGTKIRHAPSGTVWTTDADLTIGEAGSGEGTASSAAPRAPVSLDPGSHWLMDQTIDGCDSVESTAPSSPDDRESVVEWLLCAARFGVPGTVPPGPDDPLLEQRFEAARHDLRKRVDLSRRRMPAADSETPTATVVRDLLSAMKALFGEGFVILPTFAPRNGDDLTSAFAQDVLNGLGEDRLRLWVQQAAEVRRTVAELEDTTILADAWSQATLEDTAPSLAFRVAQLPFTDGRAWVGLRDAEKGAQADQPDWVRSPLSLVVASAGSLPGFTDGDGNGGRVVTAGLLLDEWSELIPAGEVNTSVAFQYDAPNAQAPQSLLLAVPGTMKPRPGLWTPDVLAAIVGDTIDLAKVRAVDLDALAGDPLAPPGVEPEPIGGILPGIYFPVDPDEPGWARDVAMNTIDEWIQDLSTATTLRFAESLNDSLKGLTAFTRDGFTLSVDSMLPPDGYPPESSAYFHHFLVRSFEPEGTQEHDWVLRATGPVEVQLPAPATRVKLLVGVLPDRPGSVAAPPPVVAMDETGAEIDATVDHESAMKGTYVSTYVLHAMEIIDVDVSAETGIARLGIGTGQFAEVYLMAVIAYTTA